MTRRRIGMALLAVLLASFSLLGSVPPADAQLFEPSSPPFGGGSPIAPAPAVSVPAPSTATSAAAGLPGTPVSDAASEFRGLWVDAYRDGFKTPDQVDRLIADARRANINALLVQVRRRGDSFYLRSLEPRTEDPDLAPGFDALAYIIDKAHNSEPRIEVQAWVVAMPIWGTKDRPPVDPNHAFNQHGISASGSADWLTHREDGASWSNGYFLDAGHPDAAKYTTDVLLNLVREYDVDGLHLDYIRYPERTADGQSWGYNDTSIARFNAQYGRSGRPAGNDPQWSQWRRDQVTNLVRGIYQGALVIKPQVKISAAVIPWGDGPRTDADWQKTSAYSSVFQDWRAWLEEGILDQAMPMTYFRESTGNQAAWLDHWVAFARDHAYGHQIIPAVALYMNEPADSVNQIRRVLAAGPNGNKVAGVSLYSYGATRAGTPDDGATPASLSAQVWSALTDNGPVNGGQAPFAAQTFPPAIAAKGSPTTGNIPMSTAGDPRAADVTAPAGYPFNFSLP